MQSFKERNPLLVKLLAVVLLVMLCCNLPSWLFWPLCMKEDLFRPFNTKILISACNKEERMRITVTPDGKALFVTKASPDSSYRLDDVYLLDLSTGEKRDIPEDPLLMETQGELLNSELVWLEGYASGGPIETENYHYRPDYILDLTNGNRYEMTDFTGWLDRPPPPDYDYTPYFQSAEQVFILRRSNRAIALPPNFRQNSTGGVILYKSQLRNTETEFKDGELLESIMKDLEVDYEVVDLSLRYEDVPSPTGKYIVRDDGIYLSETNALIVNRNMSDFQGWYYDESGVVVQERGYYLIDIGLGFGSSLEYFYIPGPTLKLRLPAP